MRTTLLLVVVAVSACGRSPAQTPAGADAAPATPVVAAPDASLAPPTREAMRATVDAIARPLVESGWTPGLVVVLVDEQGETFLPYGKLRAGGAPVDADTIFEIGSVTKVFTGLLLAQMVGDGRARLDKPVSVLLPPGTRVPTKDGREITLLDLTTHRSGLPPLPDDFDAADAARAYAGYDARRLYAFLERHVLEHAPGARHAYSNLGVALLGHALALHAGRSFERLVLDGIARPLGMTSTWFEVPADARARFAQGHDDGGQPAPEWRFDVFAPAGALRSTARDLARFVRAQLGLALAGDGVPAELGKAIDLSQEPQAAAPPTKIALGWLVSRGGRKRFHNGATAGMRSFVGFDRTGKRGVILLANATPDLIDHVAAYLLVTWSGERMAPPELPPTVVLDAATLDGYAGEYALREDFVVKVWREGDHLRARASGPGQGANALFASARDRFYYRSLDAQVEFERGAGGQVEALVLVQNGARQRGVRKPIAPR